MLSAPGPQGGAGAGCPDPERSEGKRSICSCVFETLRCPRSRILITPIASLQKAQGRRIHPRSKFRIERGCFPRFADITTQRAEPSGDAPLASLSSPLIEQSRAGMLPPLANASHRKTPDAHRSGDKREGGHEGTARAGAQGDIFRGFNIIKYDA
jgi:hypothetical protein